MVRATFIKCLLSTKFMNYLLESHNDPMELDVITLLSLFPFTEGLQMVKLKHLSANTWHNLNLENVSNGLNSKGRKFKGPLLPF